MKVEQHWCTALDEPGWLAQEPVCVGPKLWVRSAGSLLCLRSSDGRILARETVDPSAGRGVFLVRAGDALYTDARDPSPAGLAHLAVHPLGDGAARSHPLDGTLVNDTGWSDGEVVLLCVARVGGGIELVEVRGEVFARRRLDLGGYRAVGHGEGACLVAQKSPAGCGLYRLDQADGRVTVYRDERVLALEASGRAAASICMTAGGGFALDLWQPGHPQAVATQSVHEWHLALGGEDVLVVTGRPGNLVPVLLDAGTGRVRWQAEPVARVRGLGLAGPCVLVQTALHLHLLDRATGRTLHTVADANARACWHDGLLAVGGMGRLYGLAVA